MRTVDAAGLPIGDGHPPRIMGVLNVSQESPYDPSVYADPGEAAAYVDELVEDGADIVDVGLESANKRLDVLSPEAELARLDTAVETIASASRDAVFSIETRYAEVAEAALNRGFEMVNDICGFADPEMPAVCRAHDVAVCKMASPPDLNRPGAVDDVDWASAKSPAWAREAAYVDKLYASLQRTGLTDKTIVDPAFGGWSDAKTLADDQETFRRLAEFRGLGRPVLVSINRKNFLKDIVDRSTEGALPASLAATSLAVERGASVIRTHDVGATRDAALVGSTLTDRRQASANGVRATELVLHRAGELERHLDRLGITDVAAGSLYTRAVEIAGLDQDARRTLVAEVERAGGAVYGGSGSGDGVAPERAGASGILVTGPTDVLAAAAAALPGTPPFAAVLAVLGEPARPAARAR